MKTAKAQAPLAEKAMIAGGITTQARASFFIAQVCHESAGLYYREEIASGAAYNGRTDLGNYSPGDGPRFKGRGWIQLTGRNNYRAAGKALGLSLESNPTMASNNSAVMWRIAVWFWSTRNLNALADAGDFIGVTRRINGGTNGLADRQRRLKAIRNIDCRPKQKAVRPLKFGSTEAHHIKTIRAKRRIRKRNNNVWKGLSPQHKKDFDTSTAWLRDHVKDYRASKVSDKAYQRRKAQFMLDVITNRNGRGI